MDWALNADRAYWIVSVLLLGKKQSAMIQGVQVEVTAGRTSGDWSMTELGTGWVGRTGTVKMSTNELRRDREMHAGTRIWARLLPELQMRSESGGSRPGNSSAQPGRRWTNLTSTEGQWNTSLKPLFALFFIILKVSFLKTCSIEQ